MKGESFVELFFEKAKEQSEQFTQNGNIMCSNGKNISRDKLKGIFELRGVECVNASSEELESCGISSCCFVLFRNIAKAVVAAEKKVD